MEQHEKYGMDLLAEELDIQISIKEGRIEAYKAEMDKDYLYYFAWRGKELFKAYYMAGKYKELRKVVGEARSPDEVRDYLRQQSEKCLGKLLNGEIYSRYSDGIFNLAHSYRMECRQQLLQEYNSFGKTLSRKPQREEVKERNLPETKKRTNGLKR